MATLRVMEARGGLDPDVGYWAQGWDPEGRFHPLYYTWRLDSKWVNVTTLPALVLARPLFALGGYRGALLVPMAGSVLAALAARALARRLGATDASQWAAYWITGLASPLTIYALDFWEHSLGVALMAWGVVLLSDVAFAPDRPSWGRALAAGLLFGAAATMRTEALVYGAIAAAATVAVLAWRQRRAMSPTVFAGAALAAGLVLPLVANEALERGVIGTTLRAERAAGSLQAGVAGDGSDRIGEALLTAAGLEGGSRAAVALVGAALLGLLVLASRRAARDGGDGRVAGLALAGVAAIYLARLAGGLGFVPGLVAAWPLAAAGLAWAWGTARARWMALLALAALPVVWRFQFTGGAAPQWGGRYILLSGLLLAAVGTVALGRMRRWAAVFLVTLSALITAFGVAWLAERSHGVAAAGKFLAAQDQPALISRVAHLFREAGWYAPGQRWLTALTDEEVADAARIVAMSGQPRFGLVTLDDGSPPPPVPGFVPGPWERFEFVPGVPMIVSTWYSLP